MLNENCKITAGTEKISTFERNSCFGTLVNYNTKIVNNIFKSEIRSNKPPRCEHFTTHCRIRAQLYIIRRNMNIHESCLAIRLCYCSEVNVKHVFHFWMVLCNILIFISIGNQWRWLPRPNLTYHNIVKLISNYSYLESLNPLKSNLSRMFTGWFHTNSMSADTS